MGRSLWRLWQMPQVASTYASRSPLSSTQASTCGLLFFNESISGGYLAKYADTGESYPSHDCYIHGIKCYADEHRFGGIVIQTV